MAYTFQWSCVSEASPSTALVQSTPVANASNVPTGLAHPMSFATAPARSTVIDERPLPSPCIKGDALCIKICQ